VICHEVSTFSTNLELEELQKVFVARAVVSQTQHVFSRLFVEKLLCVLEGFMKTRRDRNSQYLQN
jgi:hypothetical protein